MLQKMTRAFWVASAYRGGPYGCGYLHEEDTLRITGTRTARLPPARPLHRELAEGNYRLHLRLNVDVDAGKIAARIEDGILDLNLPKAEAVKPRKIRVK